MKKIPLLLMITTIILSCNQSDNSEQITMKNQRKVIYPSDNPAERLVYENRRYKDPNTGRVPSDMRRKELMFAKHFRYQRVYLNQIGLIEDLIMLVEELERSHLMFRMKILFWLEEQVEECFDLQMVVKVGI